MSALIIASLVFGVACLTRVMSLVCGVRAYTKWPILETCTMFAIGMCCLITPFALMLQAVSQ